MTYKNNTGLKVESELEVEIPEEQLSSLLFYPMVDGYGWYIIAVYTSQPVQPQLTISPSAAPSLNPNTIPALASTMTFATSSLREGLNTQTDLSLTTTNLTKTREDWEAQVSSLSCNSRVKERRQTLVEFSSQVGIELAWAFAEMLAIKFGVTLNEVELKEL